MESMSNAGMMTTIATISWQAEQLVRTVVLRLDTVTNTPAGNAGNGKYNNVLLVGMIAIEFTSGSNGKRGAIKLKT